jgi:hypothetical protein
MQINIKRSMKFITLAVFAALIASVSAQVYSYMYIQGSGEISTGGMKWQKGTTAPSATAIVGATVTNLNLTTPANNSRIFTDCLRLINNDETSHTFSIESATTGGSAANFDAFDMVVYHNGGSDVATISIKSNGSAPALTIDASETLYVRFELYPTAGQTSGKVSFTVTLTYE